MSKVKVKILKYVGSYVPDQVVEVDEKVARHLCKVNTITDGITVRKNIRAVLLSEYEAQVAQEEADVESMTAGEMAAAGLKNVASPEGDSVIKQEEQAEQPEPELTRAQKAAATRAANKAKKEAEEAQQDQK